MTRSPSPDDWVQNFRKALKANCPPGWTVTPDRNDRMRLQVRNAGKSESLALPFSWAESDWAEALLRIRVIAKAYASGGVDLKGAAQLGAAVASDHSTDWNATAAAYRVHKRGVSDRTWQQKYAPVLEAALKTLVSKKAPTNGADLCDVALARWKPGTRQRQIMRQSLSGFLRYCVQRRNFKSCWLPPAAVDGEYVNEKRIGYPLTDAQVLRLIEAVPDTAAGRRWRFAMQLLATYGLRPEDLRYIVVRNGGTELWSTYQKSKGGKKGARTAERRLYPLLVHDVDGPVDWNLLQRFHLKEELPPLGQPGKAGEALGTFLRRLPAWKSIAAEADAEGQELVPYGFRHRYSATGHARGLLPKQLADAMGHSLEVHLGNYARFMTRDLADAFEAANAVAAPAASTTTRLPLMG